MAQITDFDKARRTFIGKANLLDPTCRVQVGAILKRASSAGLDLDSVEYIYIKTGLKTLQSSCFSSRSEAFQSEALSVATLGQTLLRSDTIGFEPLPSIDTIFERGDFQSGFRALGHLHLRKYLATSSDVAKTAITAGVEAGSRGDFPTAVLDFSVAHKHSTERYPLPEALYLLGVARLALGDATGAHAAWCVGLPLTFLALPDSRANVNWNLLIAKRLAGEEIPR